MINSSSFINPVPSPEVNKPEGPTGHTEKQKISPLSEWKKQHKIEKHQGAGPLTYIVRAIIFVALTAFTLFGSFFIVSYRTWVNLKEKYALKFKPNSVLAAIRKMKTEEEADKFKTMQNVLNDFEFTVNDEIKSLEELNPKAGVKELTKDLETKLTDPVQLKQIQKQKAVRLILRDLAREGALTSHWLEAFKDPEFLTNLNLEQLIEGKGLAGFIEAMEAKGLPTGDLNKINWTKISLRMKKEIISSDAKRVKREVGRFKKSLENLLNTLKTPQAKFHPPTANQKFIAELRRALNSPVYDALKEDLSDPAIHLLQRFASDMWNKAPAMDAYRHVGQTLMDQADIKNKKLPETGRDLAQHLEESHEQIAKTHWTDSGLGDKILYSVSHPRQSMGALASEGGMAREVAAVVGLDEYDSHGTLANNPSLQGITTMEWQVGENQEHHTKVHNCYGGSPTIGDHRIAPEFEAVLQAAENNQFYSEDKRDNAIPLIVNYNNLQNLDKKHGEGPRSRTIMLLNQKYPLSFKGTTFAKDSAMHEMRHDKDIIWKEGQDPEDFGEAMKQQMIRSFDAREKGHGFYFHGSYEKDWKLIFDKVIENANKHFQKLGRPTNIEERRTLQGAYQEYVYSMLNAINEMRSLQTLINRGIENPFIMAISACKENIDRGGMENTKYMYTRLPDNHPKDSGLALMMGVMHSRALSARDRAILKRRMPQILNFMRTTKPQEFRNNMSQLFKSLGYPVKELQYAVALKPNNSANS